MGFVLAHKEWQGEGAGMAIGGMLAAWLADSFFEFIAATPYIRGVWFGAFSAVFPARAG